MSDPRINLTGPYTFDPTLPRLPVGACERYELRSGDTLHVEFVDGVPLATVRDSQGSRRTVNPVHYQGDMGDETDPVPTPPCQEGEV